MSNPESTATQAPLVISIQSQVVHGHVGNSAAVFPMQAVGLEVAAIPTVLFSNTPDYPTLRGSPVPADLFADLLLGAEERGLPQRAAWLVTGYIGSVEVARLTAAFVARCKAANPRLRYLCDPVMGDHEPGLYVPAELAAILRDALLPMADIATPNSFELGHLTGITITQQADVERAATILHLAPDAHLVTTGCLLHDRPDGHLESVIAGPDGTSRHLTPHLPVSLPGTGDLFAGLIIAALGRGHSLSRAVDLAQELTGRALAHAAYLGTREIVLYEAGFRAALLRM